MPHQSLLTTTATNTNNNNRKFFNTDYDSQPVVCNCPSRCIGGGGYLPVMRFPLSLQAGGGSIFQIKSVYRLVTESQGLSHKTGNCIGRGKMSAGSTSSFSSGSRAGRRSFEYGRTHVVKPKGKHQATIVWLHGLGDNGSSWSQLLETLPLPNIKWICPTAPTRPVALFGGFPCTAWFDVGDLSEEAPDDLEGLDATAGHVANLLSTEPAEIKLGVGGFSMGAAAALYSAICSVHGKYSNGDPYPVNISAAVGLSGWLPSAKNLKNKLQGSQEAAKRSETIPILLCHGKVDDVVPFKYGEKSAQVFESTGFSNMTFKSFKGLGHYTIPEEMDDVCRWLLEKLGLEGARI